MPAYRRIMSDRGGNERPAAETRGNQRWGDRMGGGAVTGGVHDDLVWLNCVRLGVGVTARITPDQADELASELAGWAEQARRKRRG